MKTEGWFSFPDHQENGGKQNVVRCESAGWEVAGGGVRPVFVFG